MEKNEIVMIHGTDYVDMAIRLCEGVRLDQMIGNKNARIALKPNLVIAAKAETGAVTHPEIVDGVLQYLASKGFKNVKVTEGSWVGDRTGYAYNESGIAAVCKKNKIEYVDLQKDSSYTVKTHGFDLHLCSSVKETDFLINLPVLKGHGQTLVTCSLKNAKGLIPNSEKRRFHTMGLHKPIALLNTALPRQFILVDNICGDLDFEEGGNPVTMNRMFGCIDPVLCDAFVCESMGYTVADIPYIGYAEQLGVGCADTSTAKIIMLNQPVEQKSLRASRRVQKLAGYAEPKDACSACYGALIYAMNRLNDEGYARYTTEKVCIGQGYKGQECPERIGVGSCTRGCGRSLTGCPPKALDMVNFLKENWQ